jgi:hypothetical protein
MADKLDEYDLDEDFNEYADARFYDVSLCFTFMEMDDCITFEMVADGEVEDKISLVEAVIEGYGGVVEMDDGTIMNLKSYVNAFVIESTERKKSTVKSKFNIVH